MKPCNSIITPVNTWARCYGWAIIFNILFYVLSTPIVHAQATAPTQKPSILTNPELVPQCGIDLILVLDESGSVQFTRGAEAAVRNATSTFVNALADTGSRVALIEFGTRAKTITNYQTVTSGSNGTIATVYEPYIFRHSGHPDKYDAPSQLGGWTNWDDALEEVYTINNTSGIAPLVVFITDGSPSAYNRDYANEPGNVRTNQNNRAQSLWRAMEEANRVKQQGSHILVVGVGNGLNNSTNQQRLQDISGPDVYADLNDTIDLEQDDVLQINSFDLLTSAIRSISFELCSPSVSITKLVNDDNGYLPAAGWQFSGQIHVGGTSANNYQWEAPDASAVPGTTVTAPTQTDGTVNFQWQPTTAVTSTVRFTETLQPNYLLTDIDCNSRTKDSPASSSLPHTRQNESFQLEVAFDSIVTCVVRNTRVEITVEKSASPAQVPETGGDVTFSFAIENSGAIDLRLEQLLDNRLGDLHGQGSCSANGTITIAAGDTYTCQVTTRISGEPGTIHHNTVTAVASDGGSNQVDAQDDAYVQFTDQLPIASLTKIAQPTQLSEPGGPVNFNITIQNSSQEALQLIALMDTPYGDITQVANAISATTCVLPQTLAPAGTTGATYSCLFTAQVNGNPGNYLDTVTATLTDNDGNTIFPQGQATVEITDVAPTAILEKQARTASVDAPGGPIEFVVAVTNTSQEALTLQTLIDDPYGDITQIAGTITQTSCQTPQILAPTIQAGSSYSCTFTANITGSAGNYVDTVTAHLQDDEGNSLSLNDDATVVIVAEDPSAIVEKSAGTMSMPEPGGPVVFTLEIQNTTATERLSLLSLQDSPFGDVTALADDITKTDCQLPQSLAAAGNPGDTYSCQFTANVSGNPGSYVDVVTATLQSESGFTIAPIGTASVELTDLLPSAIVEKRGAPNTLAQPGGLFEFMVLVQNTSANEELLLTSLQDVPFGDITQVAGQITQTTCSVPQRMNPAGQSGDSYSCTFTANIQGSPGDYHDTVTATLADDEGNTIMPSADAVVSILDILPDIRVSKVSNPTSVPETGGVVTFTIEVFNNAVETANLTSLIDTVYGDLNGQGDCVTPQELAALVGSYRCQFSKIVSGDAASPDHTNIVTARAEDADGNVAEDEDTNTIALLDVLPDIAVIKSADPAPVPETGSDVIFSIQVTNQSQEAGILTALQDTIFGDLNGKGSCSVPQTLAAAGAAGDTYRCSFIEFIAADFGTPDHVNVVTAIGEDDDGNVDQVQDDETVVLTDVLPDISLTKTALPATVPESGGVVTFTVAVQNNSAEPATLHKLTDSIYGDLHGKGTCTIPQTLAANGGNYSCAFAEFVAGDFSGLAHTNVITATAMDDDDNNDDATDDATVTFTDVLPDITVIKTGTPNSLPESGADVDFQIVVVNNQTEAVTLDILTDSIYGNLHGQGSCSLPQSLPTQGSEYRCSFTAFVAGDFGGPAHTNQVTATASDDDGNQDSASDDETIPFTDVLPDITLVKIAEPTTIPESGAPVTFTFSVFNNSTEALTMTALVDNVFGDLNGQGNCAIPQTIQPSPSPATAAYQCTLVQHIEGDFGEPDHENMATVTAEDNDGNRDSAEDNATVTLLDVLPNISLRKSANPSSVPETGANVQFTVTVTNHGTEAVTVDTLIDSVYGDLDGQGSCSIPQLLATADDTYTCTFTEFVQGDFGGAPHRNLATAQASDDDGNTDSAEDEAIVVFGEDILPEISVSKIAGPPSIPESGGMVTFTVQVQNDSAEAATLITLTDTIFGDLDGRGSCSVPQPLAPSIGSYRCAFTELIMGDFGGPAHQNQVTAIAMDNEGNQEQKSDDATVRFTDVLPDITFTKTAEPTTVPESGAPVTFTLTLVNNGSEEIVIDALDDTSFGDLNGQDSCLVPQLVPANGGLYSCAFSQWIAGDFGDAPHRNVATVAVADDDNNEVFSTDDSMVEFTDVLPDITLTKNANPASVPETGAMVDFSVQIINNGTETVTLQSLVDSHFGDLNGQGDCVIPQQLTGVDRTGAGGIYNCTFSAFIVGDFGDVAHTNQVVATATDDDENVTQSQDAANVVFSDVLPDISIDKRANLSSVPETGGDLLFTFQVVNHSTEALTLTTLIDDVFGDLHGQGDCIVPQLLAENGGSYQCTLAHLLVNNFSNAAHRNRVTATAEDDDNNLAIADDETTVLSDDVLPSIRVTKVATPTNIPETGGTVLFTVVAINQSTEAATLTALVDDIFGDLHGQGDCLLPQALAANSGSYTCSFSQALPPAAGGSIHKNLVAARANDDENNQTEASDDETVYYTDVLPHIKLNKLADLELVPETGAEVLFSIEVTNPGAEDVTVEALNDSVFGDLNGMGTCTVPQFLPAITGSYRCLFTQVLSGEFGGLGHRNVATAIGKDDEGNQAITHDDAIVTFSDVPSIIQVSKTPRIATIPRDGATVDFELQIENQSPEGFVTIDTIFDTVYGDVATSDNPLLVSTTCVVPVLIVAGASHQCTFAAYVEGGIIGNSHTNLVTVTGVDDDDQDVFSSDDATIQVVDSEIAISKSDIHLIDTNDDGQVSPDDRLRYHILVSNSGNAAATDLTFVDGLDANTMLVVGSVEVGIEAIVMEGNDLGDTRVEVAIARLESGAETTFQFDVIVLSVEENTFLSNQAAITRVLSDDNGRDTQVSIQSDDPDTDSINDATMTSVILKPTALGTMDQPTQPGNSQGNGVVVRDNFLYFPLLQR